MLKIGVALSGCDIGGVSAAGVLGWLRNQGILIDQLSVCGTPALSALLAACVPEHKSQQALLNQFLLESREQNLDSAVETLCTHIPAGKLQNLRHFSANALSIEQVQVVSFTNDFVFDTSSLRTVPLANSYDLLSSVIGEIDGLRPYPLHGLRLSDYSAGYGCPIFPLHLAGCERILSFSFLPASPATSYELLISHRIQASCADADLHIFFTCPSSQSSPCTYTKYTEHTWEVLEKNKTRILKTLAFP